MAISEFQRAKYEALVYSIVFVVVVCIAGFVVWEIFLHEESTPVRQSATPAFLSGIEKKDGVRIEEARRLDLGGGVGNREEAWLLRANEGSIKAVVDQLKLVGATKAPDEFWKLPPTDWPRKLPEGGLLYESPGFSAVKNTQNVSQYFLLHDKGRGVVYVWVRTNM